MKNKVDRCDKSGCRSIDVEIAHLGEGAYPCFLCQDCLLIWDRDETAQAETDKYSLIYVSVQACVSAGDVEGARSYATQLYQARRANRAFVIKRLQWPKSIEEARKQ